MRPMGAGSITKSRTLAAVVAMSLLSAQCLTAPAYADNQMGYQLLSVTDASQLPRNQGALGLDVERAQQITDGGMTFNIIRVKQVRPGSAGAIAGFRAGDQIISLDGRVFQNLTAFAAYIGSAMPGSQMLVDYMPAGGGPAQAQRVAVKVGHAGQTASPARQPDTAPDPSTGMSTGSKIAIGAGAIALLGCYKMGCFSQRSAPK